MIYLTKQPVAQTIESDSLLSAVISEVSSWGYNNKPVTAENRTYVLTTFLTGGGHRNKLLKLWRLVVTRPVYGRMTEWLTKWTISWNEYWRKLSLTDFKHYSVICLKLLTEITKILLGQSISGVKMNHGTSQIQSTEPQRKQDLLSWVKSIKIVQN